MGTGLYDAAVIGGGPAGAAAALAGACRVQRAPRGLDARRARIQVGEGLPPAAGPLLRDLGALEPFLAAGHLPPFGNERSWGRGTTEIHDFIGDPNGNGWHLDRVRFDAMMRRLAHGRGPGSARIAAKPSGFDALLARTRHIGLRLVAGGFVRITPPCGGPASSSRLFPRHGEGWVVIGDPALAFDPLSSQGILTALYGGLRAAGAIGAELAGMPGRVAAFAEELDRVRATYRRNRQRIYAEERRWADRDFWRRRARPRNPPEANQELR